MITHSSTSLIQSCAVIGGGFAGLAASNFILNQLPHCVITLYDVEEIPGFRCASAAAGGLMHPFTPKGKLIWKGLKGFTESENLIKSCQPYSSEIISKVTPILRPCSTQDDYLQWQVTANKYPDLLETYTKDQVISITGRNNHVIGGALFKKALVIDSPLYLKSLWKRVTALSPQSKWISRRMQSPDDMKFLSYNYDVVIVAAGPSMQFLWDSFNSNSNSNNSNSTSTSSDQEVRRETRNKLASSSSSTTKQLPFKYVRGQNLFFETRQQQQQFVSVLPSVNQLSDDVSSTNTSSLNVPLLKGEYLVPSIQQSSSSSSSSMLIGGATHEYALHLDDLSDEPDLPQAESLLLPKLQLLYPNLLQEYKVVGFNAGIRVMTERSNLGKIPVIGRFPPAMKMTATDNDNYDGSVSNFDNGSSNRNDINNSHKKSNVWLLGGLGARGLIHHAYAAQVLITAIVNDEDCSKGDNESVVPKEMRLFE